MEKDQVTQASALRDVQLKPLFHQFSANLRKTVADISSQFEMQ